MSGQPPPRTPCPMQSSSQLWSLVALNAALKLVLYLLNKYCCSCLSCSLGLWG
uniref:Uncharacterized protein n=1 Tax=Aotus nancymaae TaxID=37293 RepID=A0A2K5EZG4_AOTNA